MKPEQFLLFDIAEGRRLADIGMERAAGTTGAKLWAFKATEWLDNLAIGTILSADDLIGAIGLVNEVSRDGNNYVGPWFAKMKEMGRIVQIGRIYSKRASNHGKKIDQYRKVY
jgi:hypothetical protein